MFTSDTIQELLTQASTQLSDISDSARLDAELLLAHCVGKNRTYLHTWPDKKLDFNAVNCFKKLIEKRLTDYPVAYLLGKKAFWTMDLIVTPDVLIPRPETELLVEIALEKIKDLREPRILDLGTGSGAIALALASERKDATIIATDYSENALNIATANANELKLNQQITFIRSDWFEEITGNEFDLIVSNPPYIDPEDRHLKSTIRHEPKQALIANNKGMSDIEKIIQKSHLVLNTGGFLILEHGFDQATKTAGILQNCNYQEVQNFKDLNCNYRVTLGRNSH